MTLLDRLDITSRKKNQFLKKGITCLEDLIRFFPKTYLDCTKETGILPETEVSTLVLHIDEVTSYNGRRVPVIIAKGTEKEKGNPVQVVWFNQMYLHSKIAAATGVDVFVCGKVTFDNEWNTYKITNPSIFQTDLEKAKQIYPVYRKIAGMSEEYLTTKMKAALEYPDIIQEPLPGQILQEYHLLPLKEAIPMLHFPKSMEDVDKGKERILFEELLYYALRQEWADRESAIGSPYSIKTFKLMQQMRQNLPYDLTKDQDTVLNAMVDHVREGKRINALLQGDVGSGKTIIAFLIMAAFVGSGYQAAMMAPTKILARQHYQDLRILAEPLGYDVAYLGEDLKAAEKKSILRKIEAGEVRFIVGTHSVASKSVSYHNLAITIADEEHRFGLQQRKALVEKGMLGVHSISMSATPIPRSLALVIYGNRVQLHTIMQKPQGRLPVQTGVAVSRERIYRFVQRQVEKGHQIYVVCPSIEDSEVGTVASVESTKEEYEAALSPYGIRIASITGRDKKEYAEEVLQQFADGSIDVLISTTVIEVGINVPNATGIIITSAERFGLAQLHQLRGRVGRGSVQSYCVLESESTAETNERLKILCTTTDGFEIAKADLDIRGSGDFLGTRQSGDNQMLTLILAHPQEYKKAQTAAKTILDQGLDCHMLDRLLSDVDE